MIGKFLYAIFLLICTTTVQAEGDGAKDYLIGPDDSIKITVALHPELELETRVLASGAITYPWLGEVIVGGGTTADAANKIAKGLKDKNYIVQPQVNVFVTDYQSKVFSVLGKVTKPGKYPINVPLKLTDAIAVAEGTTTEASEIVTLTSTKNGVETKTNYDLRELLASNGTKANPVIKPNDVIFVPQYPVFYVYGEVKTPGAYKLEPNMRVAQAVSVGGGLTDRGSKRSVDIEHTNADGTVTKKAANYNDLISPNDTIYVNSSWF